LVQSQSEWLSIIIVGLTGVGKTSLLYRLKTAVFPENPPNDPDSDTFMEGKILYRALNVDESESNWRLYIPWAHSILFTVDCSNEANLRNSAKILPEVINQIPSGAPFMILANKTDLGEKLEISDLLMILKLHEIQNEALSGLQIFPVSAKTGEGLAQAIEGLSGRLLELYSRRLSIHDVYIFWADSGIPIGHAVLSESQEDPDSVTILYSALNIFASKGAGFEGGIKSLDVEFPDGKTRKLVKIEREKIGVLLVCNVGDPVPLAQEVGLAVLEFAREKSDLIDEYLPHELISEIDILRKVRPFLAEEAADNLAKLGYAPEFDERHSYDTKAPLLQLLQDRLAFLHRL
jgi:GTPase SAR1 family protein